jgi:SAM-dependent MidA family methyltransferase
LIDLLEQYARHSTEMQYLHEADKIKTLIAPNVMGERFKMVHFKK